MKGKGFSKPALLVMDNWQFSGRIPARKESIEEEASSSSIM
jgi:hypothetical protein